MFLRILPALLLGRLGLVAACFLAALAFFGASFLACFAVFAAASCAASSLLAARPSVACLAALAAARLLGLLRPAWPRPPGRLELLGGLLPGLAADDATTAADQGRATGQGLVGEVAGLSPIRCSLVVSFLAALRVSLAMCWPPFWARQARLGLPSVSPEASRTPPSRLTFLRKCGPVRGLLLRVGLASRTGAWRSCWGSATPASSQRAQPTALAGGQREAADAPAARRSSGPASRVLGDVAGDLVRCVLLDQRARPCRPAARPAGTSGAGSRRALTPLATK